MTFRIQNNFNSQAENNLVSNNGIGLENVKKRLEVIYPNENHSLKIKKSENFYKVELNLNLI